MSKTKPPASADKAIKKGGASATTQNAGKKQGSATETKREAGTKTPAPDAKEASDEDANPKPKRSSKKRVMRSESEQSEESDSKSGTDGDDEEEEEEETDAQESSGEENAKASSGEDEGTGNERAAKSSGQDSNDDKNIDDEANVGESLKPKAKGKKDEETDAQPVKAKAPKKGVKATATAPNELEDEEHAAEDANNAEPALKAKGGKGKGKEHKKPVVFEDENRQEDAMDVDKEDEDKKKKAEKKRKPVPKPRARPASEAVEVSDAEVPVQRESGKGKQMERAKEKPVARTRPMATDKHASDLAASERQKRIRENLAAALLGISQLNIGVPKGKVNLTWGDVNNRTVNHSHVSTLARSIRQGKQAERYPVYVTIKRDRINLKSLSPKGTEYNKLKEPTYTEKGLGKDVKVLSGHHRQQALESLIEEYKTSLQKAKTDLTNAKKDMKKRKVAEEKIAAQVKLMTDEVERNTTLCEDTGMWAAEWYDDDILTDETRAHLSENADFPTMPADEQEKAHMLMWLVKSVAVQWARKNGTTTLPTPASPVWEAEILKHAITEVQAKNGQINFLIKHPIQYELFSLALEYPYLRDSRNLSLKQLSTAMQTPANRTLKEMRTLGTFWAWLIRNGLLQMNMIANSRRLPDVEDEEEKEAIPMYNLLQLLTGNPDDVRITEGVWKAMSIKTSEPTTKQRQKAKARQLENVMDEYEKFETEMQSIDESFMPEVFDRETLEAIDDIYTEVFHRWDDEERSIHFLDSSSDEFAEKMHEYNKEVEETLHDIWRLKRRAATSSQSEKEIFAFSNANDKLAWVLQLRELGHYPNIPFPTRSFISDSLDRLDMASPGFQSLCRLVDPLCDSIIRRTTSSGTGDVWDYVGYMLYYLSDKNSLKLFKPDDHSEHHLCTWILGNMRLLDRTSAWFLSYSTDLVKRFVTLSNANWMDPMKSQNMGEKTANPDANEYVPAEKGKGRKKKGIAVTHAEPGMFEELLPPLIRNEFPDFEWTRELAMQAMSMSGVIAALMEGSTAKKPSGGGRKAAKVESVNPRTEPSRANYKDVVARALPSVSIEHARGSNPLYILFRHAFDWRALDLRSVPDKSWSYAYRLTFAWHVHELTWGRMITHVACQKLRKSFFKFLSARALPFATTTPDAQRSDSRKKTSDMGSGTPSAPWANWDHGVLDKIKKAGKKHGLLEDGDRPRTINAVLGAAKRWSKYEADARKIVNAVRDSVSAQAGNDAELPGKANHRMIHPDVAEVLQTLLMKLAANADRLEHRMLSKSDTDPWVFPGRIGLRDSLFPPIPIGDEDPHGYHTLEDFARDDISRYLRFLRGLKSHGFDVDLLYQFIDMEGGRPKRTKDGPSRLVNPNRHGPVLPQDVSWREEWATRQQTPMETDERDKHLVAWSRHREAKKQLEDGDTPPPSGAARASGLANEDLPPIAKEPNVPLIPLVPAQLLVSKAGTESPHAKSSPAPAADVEMSPPPLNQAALKKPLAMLSQAVADDAELPVAGETGNESVLSNLTSLSLSAGGDSMHISQDGPLPEDSDEGPHRTRHKSEDPFAEDTEMDIDLLGDSEAVPMQLIDDLNRPRLDGTDWVAHVWRCIDKFHVRPQHAILAGKGLAKWWAQTLDDAQPDEKEDQIPPAVLKYLKVSVPKEASVESLKNRLLQEGGPEKLLAKCEKKSATTDTSSDLRRSGRHKLEKRTHNKVALSPQTSPHAKREAKRPRRDKAVEDDADELGTESGKGSGGRDSDDNLFGTGPGREFDPMT